MADTPTVHGLIDYVDARLRGRDRPKASGTGKEPCHPMLVVFFGDRAIQCCPHISSALWQLWPQYESSLCFLGVRQGPEGLVCSALTAAGETPLTEAGVNDAVTALFSLETHFQSRQRLLLYSVFNTAQCTQSGDFEGWMAALRTFRESLHLGSLAVSDLMFYLLDEGFSRDALSKEIRGRIHALAESSAFSGGQVLLSNRWQDNTTLGDDWRKCCRAAADLMALANNSDSNISSPLLSGRVMTVSYVCEEKPYQDIGNVVVRRLLEVLDPISREMSPAQSTSALAPRLGLTDQGTFALLDRYVDQRLVPQLPTPEQLELFPRPDESDRAMCSLWADEFRETTMGAWDCCLRSLIRQAREAIAGDSRLRDQWREAYADTLAQGFTNAELLALEDEMDTVARLLRSPRPLPQGKCILDDAADWLKAQLSASEDLIALFEDTVVRSVAQAKALDSAWQDLVDSKIKVHATKDPKLVALYGGKVDAYRDRHLDPLRQAFHRLRSPEALQELLESTLNDIIAEDPLFSSTLERELETRLQAENQPGDARQYISSLLTGSNLPVLFQSPFNLGEAVLSAILLKTDTPLYDSLSRNPSLPLGTYFYNTDFSNAVESIQVYLVGKENLI